MIGEHTRLFSSDESRRRIRWPHLLLLLCIAGLLAYGVTFVRSATLWRTGVVHMLWWKSLTTWIPLGIGAHLLLALPNYRKWLDWSPVAYVGAIALLVLVLIPGMGDTNNMGARRWLFGFFQPSEFAKLALVPTLALLFASNAVRSENRRLWFALGLAFAPALLILVQPDLGSSLPFGFAVLTMAFVAGCAKRTLFALVLAGVLFVSAFLAAILVPEKLPPEQKARVERVTNHVIFPHWKKRILVFTEPERDPLGAGWNKRQSEIAVGAGGLHGKGWGKGTQNMLGYLPPSVSNSDFIFSVIAEETGFVGSAGLLALFGGLFVSIFWAAFRTRDLAGRLLCTGVGALLFVHVFINLAMTVGLVPITGIPLPLVSYGGTFTVATLALLGLVHNVWLHPE